MQQRADLAILFADIVDSTTLYDTLGDERARHIVRRCVATMSEVTREHGGRVVAVIGDEIYGTFRTADAAMAAASAMQEAITGALIEGQRVAIHVGLHFGPALIEPGRDPTGDAVNVANRMVGMAKAGQIFVTGSTVAQCSAAWRAACRLIDSVHLRGKREPVEVHELVWKSGEATLMPYAPRRASGAGEEVRLLIGAGDAFAALTRTHPALTIGRGEDNGIIIAHAIVSRLHARAEYRDGQFVLTDQSANGTYVVPDGGARVFVHHGTHVMTGAGTVGLGEAPVPGAATALRYQVVACSEPSAASEPVDTRRARAATPTRSP